MINSIEELQNLVQEKLQTECAPQDQKFDEYLTLMNWLNQNAHQLKLNFPFEINESEKPDFVLSGKNSTTGIEVTTFQIPQEVRARAMIQGIPLLNRAPNLSFSSPRHTREELIHRMGSPPSSAGQWGDIGNEAKEYADHLVSTIDQKVRKVILEGLTKCDISVLLIEARMLISDYTWNRVINVTTPYIQDGFRHTHHFNEIWLIDGDTAVPKASVIWKER